MRCRERFDEVGAQGARANVADSSLPTMAE
jgi:hypothetical protein